MLNREKSWSHAIMNCGKIKINWKIGKWLLLFNMALFFPSTTSYTEVLSPEMREQAQLALLHQIYPARWQVFFTCTFFTVSDVQNLKCRVFIDLRVRSRCFLLETCVRFQVVHHHFFRKRFCLNMHMIF